MSKNTIPSVAFISGAYSSQLWDDICDWCEESESPESIYEALRALHECKQDEEAYALVMALYDMIGLAVPNDVTEICKIEENISFYIEELLLDFEDLM